MKLATVIISAIVAALLAGAVAAWAFGRRRPDGRGQGWSFVPETSPDASAVPVAVDPALLPDMRQRFLRAALGVDEAETETDDDPGHQQVADEVLVALERADLSQRYIPRRPHLLPQLIQSVNDSTASARSIGRIIGSDPVLTVNLLRIANSSLYRFQQQEVRSIERAVTLVGNEGIRQIISAALVQPVMNPPERDGGRFSQRLWDYTLRMSLATADHARSIEREDGFSAQLAGLLRGLGMVIVVHATAEAYSRRQTLAPSPEVLLSLLERCTPLLAARIARQWELSTDVAAALEGQAAWPRAKALARSLEVGELAAALSMLCRENLMETGEALQLLAGCVPEHVAEWLWKRVNPDDPQDE
ncbi:putative signal transduction protein [uncultured Stenotrophomonas sp.]|uniref:Putative signal transduction protein n=1 Tax=uncultured Stenotrophomonas sp. TaxID=165438 RepID=A0A1Y5Q4G0_9GAMM|nr:putative signal transduction protein [uncultured Stenotrophomonas sp.]